MRKYIHNNYHFNVGDKIQHKNTYSGKWYPANTITKITEFYDKHKLIYTNENSHDFVEDLIPAIEEGTTRIVSGIKLPNVFPILIKKEDDSHEIIKNSELLPINEKFTIVATNVTIRGEQNA